MNVFRQIRIVAEDDAVAAPTTVVEPVAPPAPSLPSRPELRKKSLIAERLHTMPDRAVRDILSLKSPHWLLLLLVGLFIFLAPNVTHAQDAGGSGVSLGIDFDTGGEGDDWAVAIQLLVFMTLLTLAPSIVMLMTSFTRIVIVLGFIGRALGTQGVPSNQIIVGLSLFLTFFVMGPTWNKVYDQAIVPYQANQMTSKEALDIGADEMRTFMLKQTRENDLEFFLGLAGRGPTQVSDLPLNIVMPAFVLSELRTAFQMGFLIFVPFLIVDFIVASTLMSMGMMMMPPVVISLPFKILLFVLVDGWTLVIRSVVQSFVV